MSLERGDPGRIATERRRDTVSEEFLTGVLLVAAMPLLLAALLWRFL